MTTEQHPGSHIFWAIALVISGGCSAHSDAQPAPERSRAPDRPPSDRMAPPAAPEACLGLSDTGIFADLDTSVQIALPAGIGANQVTALLDPDRQLLVVELDGFPRKAYPLGAADGVTLAVGDRTLTVRPGDRAELAPLLTATRIREGKARRDRDGDGIPDALDLLIGAKKTVLNAAAYTREAQGYIKLAYPRGDVDRTIGVCTDVVIRAARNAGLDLQQAVHEDIKRRRTAYPMVKKGPDANIDHRRVGTLLPYFKKHWEQRTARLDDPEDPLRPGDIILMDTFPSRSGPDHIGIVSDRLGPSGLPLIINNWTNGTVTSEMDLLSFVPVLYRFRLPT
jgi:uncharacterized protein YijF (DUF1287 family)